jgi:hypothetical protein
MGFLDIPNALDGDDVFAIDAGEWRKTRIHTGMVDLSSCWVVLRYDNRASTTTTLATATVFSLLV